MYTDDCGLLICYSLFPISLQFVFSFTFVFKNCTLLYCWFSLHIYRVSQKKRKEKKREKLYTIIFWGSLYLGGSRACSLILFILVNFYCLFHFHNGKGQPQNSTIQIQSLNSRMLVNWQLSFETIPEAFMVFKRMGF